MTPHHFHPHGHVSDTDQRGDTSDARLVGAICVNGVLSVVQVVGGLLSGSLALVADALHNLSDAGALIIALVSRRIGRRPADHVQTFGYRRAELVGALINATSLNLVGLYLVANALGRVVDPPSVQGWPLVIIATGALVVDLVTAYLTYRMAKDSLNVKAAFVHNMADAFGSVAVIVAGVLALRYQLYIADVVATLLIAAYAMYHGVGITKEAGRILALGTPVDIQVPALADAIREVEGVVDVHHVHVWQLDESERSFEGHIVVGSQDVQLGEQVKKLVRGVLERYGITHATLECEFGVVAEGCREGEVVAPH
ncbi:MAG: cation transporter [Acidimicrobiaceae bacterium]|nr:cation transporter [Acidobacteriota bacterium]MBJ82322.1 cation transporter [Acidimicrobiaceae bacterium]